MPGLFVRGAAQQGNPVFVNNFRGERQLTSRQREVLQLIAHGKRVKEIAADLNISVRTVEDHKSQLLVALGVKSTAL